MIFASGFILYSLVFGENYSRYDIVDLIKPLTKDDQFIILLDDFNRKGEKETYNSLLETLKTKGIDVHTQTYDGLKSTSSLKFYVNGVLSTSTNSIVNSYIGMKHDADSPMTIGIFSLMIPAVYEGNCHCRKNNITRFVN